MLATTVKPKPHSMKCRNCAWSTRDARKHPNVIYTMKRLYVRKKSKWQAIGWFCNICGSVVLDNIEKRKYFYFQPPDPKLTISRRGES